MQKPTVTDFVIAAKEFILLGDKTTKLNESDLWRIRDILLRLVYHISAIENALHDTQHSGKRLSQDSYQRVVNQFAVFPFNAYRVVFDPHDFDALDEPVTGALSDDLSDIYRDLAEGLDNYQNGHIQDACSDWAQSYQIHWARHAVNAISAIENYRINNWLKIE